MIYLKAIIGKLKLNRTVSMTAQGLKTDEEILNYLKKFVPENEIISHFEKHYGIEYVSLADRSIPASVLKKFDLKVLESTFIFPYDYDELTKTFHFALNNLVNSEMRNKITLICRQNGTSASFKFAFEEDLKNAFAQNIKPAVKTDSKPTQVPERTNEITTSGDFDAPKFVSESINKALRLGASDVHIERLESGLQIRYRIDGIMAEKQIFKLNEGEISSVYVRIKGISNMDISEKRKPQDGRIDNYEFNGSYYDLRVSTVTTILGEKVVMRVFDKSGRILSFKELGFGEAEEESVVSMLKSQNGIILMAGATGSGKTTTLYTMIDEINSDEINVYTIEDPVEKTIKNVNQILIDPKAGVDYPSTLKALLRQDPDVIVVGEIRDLETAALSVRASLTGHLVLSTVHANGALDAISRMLDMGIEPYLLGASAQGFLSQRLVRKLCPHCKKKVSRAKPHEERWIRKVADEYNISNPKLTDYYEPVGCPHCVKGYKGRIAIVEVIKITENVRNLLSNGASLNTIREKAIEEGFVPMEINALNKAADGITSLDELVRKLS